MDMLTVLDGGLGRELKEIGAPFSQPLWSAQALMEAPQYVAMAHQRFIDAGAEIIITNAYACVPFHLGDKLYQEQGSRLAQLSAEIARTVADDCKNRVQVAGCIPPAMGSYRPDLFDAELAKPIIETLYLAQDKFVDLWIIETLASIKEFHLNHSILSQSSKPSYYAFTLEDTLQDEAKLRSGETVKDAAYELVNCDIQGMLFNCSVPEVIEQAIKDAKSVFKQAGRADIEIGAYANNFEVIEQDHEANDALQSMRSLTPEEYLNFAKKWKRAGANIIGGCCGIGPKYIQALSDWKRKGAI